MVWGGRREEGSGWGTRVYLWRIHVDIWQNQYNIVKLKKKKYVSTYLFLAVLGLCCCLQALSSRSEWGLLVAVASVCRAWALGTRASGVATCGLRSCGSRALEGWPTSCGPLVACGNLPGAVIKPMSPALANRFLSTGPPGKPLLRC